ncbi:hypothetical protein SHELI_v1c10050 [Spiroplasma helicoides]|uniref:Spiralin n=1 Tax=Spiroplasma helicoides TaxID=216938 RepID=A0A1B3SLZ8_9MOLU|nr:lipoprotein [Spiroplasma helicoides]AOG60952.1 hypothetical protein SHELI_v1c10050 [Spiroplasma helicoides]
MKKLLSLLAATGLVATSGSVAVACNKKADDKAAATTKDLSTITGDSLKLAPTANDQAAAETAAIARIKEKLSVDVVKGTDFTIGEKDFTAATSSAAGSLKVTAKTGSTKLTEGKTVTFSLTYKAAEAAKTDLSKMTTKALGEFKLATVDTKPTLTELVSAVNKVNSNYDLAESDVEIASSPAQTTTGATLTAKSDSAKFTGSVAVTYTVAKAEEAKKPVITLDGISENKLDITLNSGNAKKDQDVTISVANSVSGTLPTVKVADGNDANLSAGAVSAIQDQSGKFKVTLSAKAAKDSIVVTFSYAKADNVTLTVNVKANG